MINKLIGCIILATGALSLPSIASAVTGYVTVTTGQTLYIDVSGTTDGNITIVNTSNNQTAATVTAYNMGSYVLTGTAYSPISFTSDGSGNAHVSGLPAGNYAVTFTSDQMSDYGDNYNSSWAELELYNPYDSSAFMECDINVY